MEEHGMSVDGDNASQTVNLRNQIRHSLRMSNPSVGVGATDNTIGGSSSSSASVPSGLPDAGSMVSNGFPSLASMRQVVGGPRTSTGAFLPSSIPGQPLMQNDIFNPASRRSATPTVSIAGQPGVSGQSGVSVQQQGQPQEQSNNYRRHRTTSDGMCAVGTRSSMEDPLNNIVNLTTPISAEGGILFPEETDKGKNELIECGDIEIPTKDEILRELSEAVPEMQVRGLLRATQWAADLSISTAENESSSSSTSVPQEQRDRGRTESGVEQDVEMDSHIEEEHFAASFATGRVRKALYKVGHNKKYPSRRTQNMILAAKSHFDLRQYMRAYALLEKVSQEDLGSLGTFIKWYSLYLFGETRKEQEIAEQQQHGPQTQAKNTELNKIEKNLLQLRMEKRLDPLSKYVLGIALKALNRKKEARQILSESIRAFPWNWSAWSDYLGLILDELPAECEVEDILQIVEEPNHWMSLFFRAAVLVECQRNTEALEAYHFLRQIFPGSTYILSQVATVEYNAKQYQESLETFEKMRFMDPYKWDAVDTYSNILYVKENAPALSHLAKLAITYDKYSPETCCIIGNYFSLKSDHEKAVSYFQRALALNRNFTPAWILQGHEFMEMKSSSLAIESYRTALQVNKRDYRAWYGLGQTYELLNLYHYALYYYRRAAALRPNDARMWTALGGCFDCLDKRVEALRCYERAYKYGDAEGLALCSLARLYAENPDAESQDMAAYHSELLVSQQGGEELLSQDVVDCLRFLMLYYRKQGDVGKSLEAAERLLHTSGPQKDEAKEVIQQLKA